MLQLAATALANLVPLLGVLYLDWSAFALIALYWLEDLVIFGYHLPRVLLSAFARDARPHRGLPARHQLAYLSIAGLAALIASHGLILLYVFGLDRAIGANTLIPPTTEGFRWALLGLVLSHGVTFVTGFLQPRRWRTAPLLTEAVAPVPRVLALTFALAFGGLIAAGDGGQNALLLLVLFKTTLDLAIVILERRRAHEAVTDTAYG